MGQKRLSPIGSPLGPTGHTAAFGTPTGIRRRRIGGTWGIIVGGSASRRGSPERVASPFMELGSGALAQGATPNT